MPVWASGVSLVVADGLGGHGDGDRASNEAVRYMYNFASRVLPWLSGPTEPDHALLDDELRRTVHRLHERITRKALDNGLAPAMGTTLTFCYVADGVAHIAHAGDSRCYLLRDGRLIQLTTDHTLAHKLIASGLVSRDMLSAHLESTLCNCLGGGVEDVFAEIHQVPVRAGDALLLCTDGLTKHVSDAYIERILAAGRTASWTCERLIHQAIAGGGTDNVTVAACRLVDCTSAPRIHPLSPTPAGRR